MRKLKFWALTMLSVVLLFVLVELISHLVLHKIYNRSFDSSIIEENKYITSPGLKGNASAKIWGKNFHTDERGCRKSKTGYDAKKKTWLYIGDSVTEGVGVDDSSTFASLSADEFTETNLLNYSLIGYSAADYLNVLQSVLSKDSSVELVTLFFCLNDVYGGAKTSELPVMAKQNLLGKVNGLLQDRCAAYKLIKLFFYQNSSRYFDYDLQFYTKQDEHFQQTTCYIYSCDSLCKANNIYFNLVALPYRSQLASHNFKPQTLLSDFCKTHDIDFSNAAQFLSKQADTKEFYLFADEIHFSEKGHRAIAEYLRQ